MFAQFFGAMRMSIPNAKELERLATVAELARPLVHECNNFLNNLFLQMSILVAELPEEMHEDWGGIKQEGKRLTSLLRQWQSFPAYMARTSEQIELNQLLLEVVHELPCECESVQVTMLLSDEPLWITGFPGSTKRLCSLLLQYALAILRDEAHGDGTVALRTGTCWDKAVVLICDMSLARTAFDWQAFGEDNRSPLALVEAACISLAERVQGCIRVARTVDNRVALIVELPMSLN
jgi:hypothetical protein